MRPTLLAGLEHELRFTVTESKTVPHLYPESGLFRGMPAVFATGFMVGLMEWACLEAIQPHLDAGEASVGVEVRVTHSAATPPGFTVTVRVRLDRVAGRRLGFTVSAHDGVDVIGEGTHDRMVIDVARFSRKVEEKALGGGHEATS